LFGPLALLRTRHRQTTVDNLRHAGLYTPWRTVRVAMELGKSLLELPRIWLKPQPEVAGWVREVEGWEHVEAALARGHGIVLMGPHLGSLEMAGTWLATRIPVTYLYQRVRQDWFNALLLQGRQRGLVTLAEPNLKGVRALLTALRKKQSAWILPDQTANEGEGFWQTFFGRWAYMPTLPYRLLQSEQAEGLLFYCQRLSWGRGYRLHFEPLPELPADHEAAARLVNARMEAMIRTLPEQYLWNYRIHRQRDFMPPRPEQAPA
jgi:KDO2-lipid IV(A) lauroyltransferase